MPRCYRSSLLEDNTQQLRLARDKKKKKKNQINQELSGETLNIIPSPLPKEECLMYSIAPCQSLGV